MKNISPQLKSWKVQSSPLYHVSWSGFSPSFILNALLSLFHRLFPSQTASMWLDICSCCLSTCPWVVPGCPDQLSSIHIVLHLFIHLPSPPSHRSSNLLQHPLVLMRLRILPSLRSFDLPANLVFPPHMCCGPQVSTQIHIVHICSRSINVMFIDMHMTAK